MSKKDKNDSLIGGLVLILVGSILFFNTTIGWGLMWPLFVSMPAFILLIIFIIKGESGTLIPIVILLTISGLFMCFTTGLYDWGDLVWLWPVFILGPGVGLLVYSLVSKEYAPLTPAIILITLALLFFINWSYWPVALIILGLVIIFKNKKKN